MGAGKQGDAANVASYMPEGGVSFTLPNDYTVTVETMPRDDITDLALLTFARMGSVTSLADIEKQAETICQGLGKESPTARQVAQRVQSTFLNKPELASLMQHSICNPRSGQEAWALASQVGEPTGPAGLDGPDGSDKLQAPIFPAGELQAQLDFVKQVNLSNLATKLGISGFPRNAVKQTIKNPQGKIVSEVFGTGTPDNSNAEAAQQVMQSLPENASMVALLAESNTVSSVISNLTGLFISDESNTGNILQTMKKVGKLPKGMTADSVSAYSGRTYAKKSIFGKSALQQYVDGTIEELSTWRQGVEKSEGEISAAQRAEGALQSIGKPDDDNRTLAIALASYAKSTVMGKPSVVFCKSGKDRTGAVVNMITAIGMLDDQLNKRGQALDLSKQANIEKLADNYRMLQQAGVRNFISGLNSEGAGVLKGIDLLPKAFKEYYEGEPEGQKFLAELEVANALGKQNKGWKGSEQKDLEKKRDAIKGQLTDMANLEKSLQSTNLLAKLLSFVLRRKSRYDALKTQEPILSARLGIYEKGLDALKTIKAKYETREKVLPNLKAKADHEAVLQDALNVISTPAQLEKGDLQSEQKKGVRFAKEDSVKYSDQVVSEPSKASKEVLEEVLEQLASKMENGNYSDAQKVFMQQVIEGVKNETIGINGNPADLFKQIQESVVQQDALKVIKEVLSEQKTEAEIVPGSEIGRDSDESEALLRHEEAPTPEEAVIKGLEEIQAGYSSEQKALMQGVIEALTEGTITLDGNPSEEGLLNQIRGAIDGSGRETIVTNPPPPVHVREVEERHIDPENGRYLDPIPAPTTTNNIRLSSLKELSGKMKDGVQKTQERTKSLTAFDNKENDRTCANKSKNIDDPTSHP